MGNTDLVEYQLARHAEAARQQELAQMQRSIRLKNDEYRRMIALEMGKAQEKSKWFGFVSFTTLATGLLSNKLCPKPFQAAVITGSVLLGITSGFFADIGYGKCGTFSWCVRRIWVCR